MTEKWWLIKDVYRVGINMTKGMKKTYADQCLERAEKATEGPWECLPYGDGTNFLKWQVKDSNYYRAATAIGRETAEFIAHARTDVPELARRLKEACTILNSIGIPTDELESDIEKEK